MALKRKLGARSLHMFCPLPQLWRQISRFLGLQHPQQTGREAGLAMKVVTDSAMLEALGPSIAEILRVSGAAGASVGVFDGRTQQTHLAGLWLP